MRQAGKVKWRWTQSAANPSLPAFPVLRKTGESEFSSASSRLSAESDAISVGCSTISVELIGRFFLFCSRLRSRYQRISIVVWRDRIVVSRD